MKQLFLILLLLMFVSTSVFAEGLGVHAALQQANPRTRTRTIPNEVNISFLSSHDLPSHDLEDDTVSDWLPPLLIGVGGTGLAVAGTFLLFSAFFFVGGNTNTGGNAVLFALLTVPGSVVGISGFIAFFESIF